MLVLRKYEEDEGENNCPDRTDNDADKTLGKAIWVRTEGGYHRCSACGYVHDIPDYTTENCPKCGAEMEGEYDW